MSSPFFAYSKDIANEFLTNVVFIDDKAFDVSEHKGQHDFDAYSVTKAFASHKKICAIYKPKELEDVVDLTQLSKHSDVTVLDWFIDIPLPKVEVENEEDDDDTIDPRGVHTLKIIRDVLSDPTTGEGSLKLVIIYTGEINLDGIADSVYNDLQANGVRNLKKDFCEVCTENIKVLIIAKPDPTKTPEQQFPHNPNLRERIKSYQQLPEYILDRFTELTAGLLSNFALKSLTVIRENTFRFLQLYNRNLDKAFLAHRLLLPDQDDSKELLTELFAHSVYSLLQYNQAASVLNEKQIISWAENQTFTGTIKVANKNIPLTKDFVCGWLELGFKEICTNKWTEEGWGTVDEKKLIESINKLDPHFLSGEKNNQSDIDFSVLTHHKSIFKPSPVAPRLTLGTIIKGEKSDQFWICIQQRCDSVRIDGPRRFLFLPLDKIPDDSDRKFHFITAQGTRLRVNKKSYDLRTIKFTPSSPGGAIKAKWTGEKFVFEPDYFKDENRDFKYEMDEQYEWVLDLKDLHAQRIAVEFSAQLSRVGLDESEWLRRWSP